MLSAKLHLDGTSKNKDIQLKSFEYQFNVKVNELGKPESNVHGGIIELSFKSIEDKDFIEWMILEAGDKSGTIEIAGDTQSKAFRTMEFSGARLVHFSESFAEPDDMITKIKISARKIILEGVAHESYLGKYKRFAKSALKSSGAIAEGAGGAVRGAYYTNRLLGDDKELKVDVNLPDEPTPPADNIAEGRRGGSAGSNTAFIPPISRPATPGNFKESKNLAEEVKEGAEKGKQEKDKETETESEEIS